jgi:hypothetical protein
MFESGEEGSSQQLGIPEGLAVATQEQNKNFL